MNMFLDWVSIAMHASSGLPIIHFSPPIYFPRQLDNTVGHVGVMPEAHSEEKWKTEVLTKQKSSHNGLGDYNYVCKWGTYIHTYTTH